MKHLNILLILIVCLVLVACSDGKSNAVTDGDIDNEDAIDGDTIDGGAEMTPPLELTTDLCDDPSNMAILMDAFGAGDTGSMFGGANEEQVQRMMQAPTEGPFYMFNLLKYRDKAVYSDGRETDLTGREANALYAPVEFLQAIAAQPVYMTEVSDQIDGNDIFWDEIAPLPAGTLCHVVAT